MTDDMKIHVCRDDFYLMMRNAVIQAGGADNVDKWKKMKFEEVVDMMAQNGIRMVHMHEKHMNSVEIVWKKGTKYLPTPDVMDQHTEPRLSEKRRMPKPHKSGEEGSWTPSEGYTIVDGVKIWDDDNEK